MLFEYICTLHYGEPTFLVPVFYFLVLVERKKTKGKEIKKLSRYHSKNIKFSAVTLRLFKTE